MTVIEGIVEHGDARGRTIGFPTSNLSLHETALEDGVWAAQVRVGSGKWAVAAVSIGRRRTFYGETGPRLLEAHLLDFDGDLYGYPIRVELMVQLRGQQGFSSAAALIRQLDRDVEDTRVWAAEYCPWLLPAKVAEPPVRQRA